METQIELTKLTKRYTTIYKGKINLFFADIYSIEESRMLPDLSDCTKLTTTQGVINVTESYKLVNDKWKKWIEECKEQNRNKDLDNGDLKISAN